MVTAVKQPGYLNTSSAFAPLTMLAFVLSGLYLAPILAVFVAASGDSGGLWIHLSDTVLPRYVMNTLILISGVGAVSLAFGVSSAWVIFRYDFPGRGYFEWMLLLPAAVPAYLVAYTYTDFLEFAGPVQTGLRSLFGWESAREYWFPEVRSMQGAVLIMGAVLYPYVYLMARTAFTLTPQSFYQTGLVSGRNLFWSVGLPLGRPAIIAGLALVLMEAISDFGTVDYFAIETLTLGIFNVWLGMNSLTAAAQIAVLAFIFILMLLVIEVAARSKQRFTNLSRRATPMPPKAAMGWSKLWCILCCLLPFVIGFVIPVAVLLNFVLQGYSLSIELAVGRAAMNALMLAGIVAILVMCVATLMGVTSAYQGGPNLRRVSALSSIGYAFPGTILAIGVVTAAGAFDSAFAYLSGNILGIPADGFLIGGLGLVIIACAVRFQAIGYGAMTTGIARLPPNMLGASRILGRNFNQSVLEVLLPLLTRSFIAGGLLVFVDVMKELPMTLLLRPFNYETLATYVYQYAKDELLEQAALPALLIVATGIIPVLVMNAALKELHAKN
ncbi:MAG: iron ABC transporter permease [Hyphomicrobiales bacterium]|nr:iron ABC transporter permease [Hyphomicrobiales bacterium]